MEKRLTGQGNTQTNKLCNRIDYLQQLNHQQETEKRKLIEKIKEIHNEHEDYETSKHTTTGVCVIMVIEGTFYTSKNK